MCPPTTSPLADIDFDCTFEKLFLSLEKLNQGCPPPRNVITYVNPYNHYPSTLPDGIWYFIHSKENNGMELGFWKAKDEACKIFSNSILTGWRTTLEFFKGKVPHEQKTDWMMEEYWITHKALGGNSKAKVDSSLCRVFLSAQQGLDHKLEQKMTSSKIVEEPCPFLTESIVPKAHSVMSNGSTSKPEVGIDEAAREMALAGGPSNHLVENLPAVDYFSGGDYLELLDLVNPASPSSSSDNSSCLTMSSDEYFDSLALLRDIESDNKQIQALKDDNITSNVSVTLRLNYRDEGPSSHSVGESESSSSGGSASPHGEKKTSKNKMRKLKKKKKYLCFVPFNFLF